jgi:hypothetical protein
VFFFLFLVSSCCLYLFISPFASFCLSIFLPFYLSLLSSSFSIFLPINGNVYTLFSM